MPMWLVVVSDGDQEFIVGRFSSFVEATILKIDLESLGALVAVKEGDLDAYV